MADPLQQIAKFLSSVFFIPSSWFLWPRILNMLIVPMLLIWYAMKKLLDIIGIFRGAGSINSIIAAVFAFFLLPSLAVFPFAVIASSMFIFMTIPGTKKKIAFVVLLYVFYFIITPQLSLIKI